MKDEAEDAAAAANAEQHQPKKMPSLRHFCSLFYQSAALRPRKRWVEETLGLQAESGEEEVNAGNASSVFSWFRDWIRGN